MDFPFNISRRRFLQIGAAAALASINRQNSFASISASALAHDSNRPQFHMLPAANWMNDPNGPIFYKGRYHLFCQYNPHAAVWGDMHWAHAVSPDMVHWKHMPIALAPTTGGPDQDGCFTGSAVLFNGKPTFLYTGVKTVPANEATLKDANSKFRESQCLATSNDSDLKSWTKQPAPVIASPPPGLDITGFRDPCLWQEDDMWYMGVGSGIRGKGGCVLLYRSHDLRSWEYLYPFASGQWRGKASTNPVDSGEMWECPDFFALDGHHVLLYSTEGKVIWTTGEYDPASKRYEPKQQGVLDHDAYYAPKSMLDANGNRILWGWIPERRPEAEHARAGWAGSMSLPRVLTVNEEGQLQMRAAPQLEMLRERTIARLSSQKAVWPLRDLRAELQLSPRQQDQPVSLTIRSEETVALTLTFDPKKHTLEITSKTRTQQVDCDSLRKLDLYLDGSVIETFVNDGIAITSRLYDLHPHATHLEVEGASAIQGATVWQLRPISSNRLTT